MTNERVSIRIMKEYLEVNIQNYDVLNKQRIELQKRIDDTLLDISILESDISKLEQIYK